MTSELFFSFMTSLLICMALIPLLRFLAVRFQVMDQPGERKVHHNPVPTFGGIAFAVGACTSILWWAPKDNTTMSVLLGGTIILGFGVWDDRANLGYRIKLLGQLVAALGVVVLGGIRFESIPFLLDAELPMWIGIPITVFFLVAVTNAVNLADGLDGLAGGLSFLSLCGIAYLAHISNDSTVLFLTLPFLGGLLGFLRYNTYPARIFMGDGGSQLLGFIMGVLGILVTNSNRGPFNPALLLFLLGLPFLDTLGVIAQRLVEGRSPFIGDRRHTHHKLLTLGLSHYEAVTVIYAIQAGMLFLAYLLRWQSDVLIIPLYLLLAGSVLLLFVAAGHGLIPEPQSKWRFLSNMQISSPWLTKIPIKFLAVTVPLFLTASVFIPSDVPVDIGYMSLALFGIILLGLSVLPRLAPYFVRVGLYVGTTFLIYVSDNSWMRTIAPVMSTYYVLFGAMAVMVLLSMRFDSQCRFQTTPLDYLMIFLAVILPFLPEVNRDMPTLGLFSAELIILFFSFELLLHAFSEPVLATSSPARGVKQLGFLSLWVLFGLGVRIWL